MMNNMEHRSFVEEGAEELTGRFLNTFIGVASNGVVLPIYVRSIAAVNKANATLSINGTIYSQEIKDWVPYDKSTKEIDISYFPPTPGMRNYLKGALYYDIIPVRHRYRGLRREQLKCIQFDPKVEENYYAESSAFQYSIFNPAYYDVRTALELVGRKKLTSAAFSSTFAVIKSRSYKHLVFVYKGRHVGIYSKNDHVAVLPGPAHHLSEELSKHITCIKDNA